MTIRYVQLYLDDTGRHVRNGWRHYLVMPPGRKWTKVIDIGTADVWTLSNRELEENMKFSKPLPFKRTRRGALSAAGGQRLRAGE